MTSITRSESATGDRSTERIAELVDALRESWNLVADLDASLKGLPLLRADRERIAESIAASRSAIAKATGAA